MKKICTKCKIPKSLDDFYNRTTSKDGHRGTCKKCDSASSIGWAKAHPEKTKKYSARWRKTHPETMRKNGVRWQKENPEKYRALKVRWRKENAEKNSATKLRWQRKNAGKCRAGCRRRRANRHNVSENFTAEMARFVKSFWHYRCAICGSKPKIPHVDHWRPLSKNFALDLDNAVVMCVKCNSSKGSKMPRDKYSPEFVDYIEFRMLEQEAAWMAAEAV